MCDKESVHRLTNVRLLSASILYFLLARSGQCFCGEHAQACFLVFEAFRMQQIFINLSEISTIIGWSSTLEGIRTFQIYGSKTWTSSISDTKYFVTLLYCCSNGNSKNQLWFRLPDFLNSVFYDWSGSESLDVSVLTDCKRQSRWRLEIAERSCCTFVRMYG